MPPIASTLCSWVIFSRWNARFPKLYTHSHDPNRDDRSCDNRDLGYDRDGERRTERYGRTRSEASRLV
jgi:hypothetical protein